MEPEENDVDGIILRCEKAKECDKAGKSCQFIENICYAVEKSGLNIMVLCRKGKTSVDWCCFLDGEESEPKKDDTPENREINRLNGVRVQLFREKEYWYNEAAKYQAKQHETENRLHELENELKKYKRVERASKKKMK